jgi:hypothetical protein
MQIAHMYLLVFDRKSKTSRVDALVSPNEKSTEDGLGEEVEYTIEYCFGVGCNDISTFCYAPSNRI